MITLRALFAIVIGVGSLLSAASAEAECLSSGAGSKFKVSMVRPYEKCGYRGREANGIDESGIPACSTPTLPGSTETRCGVSDEACSTNADCSPGVCALAGGGPCDSGLDCIDGACFSLPIPGFFPANTCEPSGDFTSYQFGPKGGCSLSGKSKVESDCSAVTDSNGMPLNLPPGVCHVTYLSAKCKGILQSDGVTPINGIDDPGWALFTKARITLDDSVLGSATLLDLSIFFPFSDPQNGSMSMRQNTAEALSDIIGPAFAALPPCTVVEFVETEIWDPDGSTFARVGLSTH